MSTKNYNEADYMSTGAPSYYLRDKMIFSVGGVKYPVLNTGFAQPFSAAMLLAPTLVHIATPQCAAYAAANCYHQEGPVRVADYESFAVMPDTGTLFRVKAPWLGNFMAVIAFTPIVMPPV